MAKPVLTASLGAVKRQETIATSAPHVGQLNRWGRRVVFPALRSGTKPAFWLGAYSRFLFAVFIAYHTAMLVVAMRLVEVLVGMQPLVVLPRLWKWPWQFDVNEIVLGACFVALVMVILRLIIEVWQGVAGLVTSKLDLATETNIGVECTEKMASQLHELIREVGSQVRSPLPNVVRISPRAECYVCELRRFSISTQRRLMLVLGLPHLAVLNTSELEVIVAHELAHFRGGDTRLGVFLHRFLESLRDANDRQRRTRWIDPVYWIRSGFFRVALLLVAPVWKHQELRADVASANAYGGPLTARTLLREWLLGQQFEATVQDYVTLSSNKRLQETLSQFNIYREFAVRFQRFTPQAEEFVRQRLALEEKSSLFDSHPTMHSRVDAVLAYPDREMPNLRPASHLVSHFSDLEDRMQRELFEGVSVLDEQVAPDDAQKLRHFPSRNCA